MIGLFSLLEIGISEFKAKCIQLLKATAQSGYEVVVTLRGKPLAKLVGISARRPRVLECPLLTADDMLLSYPHVLTLDARL